MALLALLAEWNGSTTFLFAATVDHGLRSESSQEAELVASFARQQNVPHTTLNWSGAKPTTGIQSAAREARYALLVDHAQLLGCSSIATAHHADDQAETVLMRLIAGSGIHGLAGMRGEVMRAGVALKRPFLSVPKSRLIATCVSRGAPYITDPSNSEERYGRVKIRRLLAELEQDGLTVARLCKLADRAAEANDALDATAKQVFSGLALKSTECLVQFHWNKVSSQPKDIRLRVLLAVLRRSPAFKNQLRLERVEALLADIDLAYSKQLRTRRTLSDLVLTLQSSGLLTITMAPTRKRGTNPRVGTVLGITV